MRKKVFILTFGCQMNEYDSNKIIALLEEHGFTQTFEPQSADLLLINTCSVREKAQEKIFSTLGEWAKLKKINNQVVIGVGGCVASQEGKNIIKRANCVNIVFGPQTIHRIPALYDEFLKKQRPVIDINFPEIEKFNYLPIPKKDKVSAYVTIMEGCNNYCSYCIVPYTRGKEINRPFDDVMKEILLLAKQGVKEITLLGQNVNNYIVNITDDQSANLANLISYIAIIDSIKRIRFFTSHPNALSENLLNAFQEIPKLVNHLHLPIQSGSNRILKLMRRGYTIEEYIKKIYQIKNIRPNIKISTDIIVGFPNETEQDFQQTLDLVDQIKFDTSYSFIYSKRSATPAAMIADKIPLETKKERLQILQYKLRHYAQQYSRQMIDTIQPVLVTGVSKKDSLELTGRTECNKIVNFPGNKYIIGELANIKITDMYTNCFAGKLIEVL